MKKKIMILVIIVFFIIVAVISEISKHNNDIKNKENENKRYAEIKNCVKKAVEWNINAMYPNCPINDNFDEEKSKTTGNFYNSSFLIDNGYLKKDELLDVDGKNYCDVYVIIQSTFENPQDHQNNCSISYKFYLKCIKYKDKGYKDWGSK